MNDPPSTVAVLGPGAVGGLLAGLLARSGVDVLCLAREPTAELLSERGITIRSSKFGDFTVPVRSDTCLRESVSACLITVKAFHLEEAVARVPAEQLGGAILVPFLNGIDHVARLRSRYPGEQVVAGTIRVEATRDQGRIDHMSPFVAIELAEGEESVRAQVAALGKELEVAGAAVTIRPDEKSMLWQKLCLLAPLALLTTDADAPAGTVRSERRSDLLGVVHEAVAAAKADDATVDEESVIAWLDGIPAEMKSSMQRDASAGREIELEAIGGPIVRAADQAGRDDSITARLVAGLSQSLPKRSSRVQ